MSPYEADFRHRHRVGPKANPDSRCRKSAGAVSDAAHSPVDVTDLRTAVSLTA